MSRITTPPPPFRSIVTSSEGELRSAFGRVTQPVSPEDIRETLDRSHAGLTRLHFTRSMSEDLLKGKQLTLVPGSECGTYTEVDEETGEEKEIDLKKGANAARLWLKIDPPIMAKKTAAWDRIPTARGSVAIVPFFSKQNKKMKCPSFALPAGAPEMGGTCIGASAGQTIALGKSGRMTDPYIGIERTEKEHREGMASVRMHETICSTCYASVATSAQHSSVQIEEMARYMYLLALTENQIVKVLQAALDAEKRAGLPKTLLAQVADLEGAALAKALDRPEFMRPSKGEEDSYLHNDGSGVFRGSWGRENPSGRRYFRIHDSGDAYDFAYAKAWIRVCEQNDDVLFWMPTRTHVLPSWAKWWAKQNIPENLAVRPSAYHFGDPAPMVKGMAPGTCSLYEAKVAGKYTANQDKKLADFVCPVYFATDHDTANCLESTDSQERTPCRVCWEQKQTINYTAH